MFGKFEFKMNKMICIYLFWVLVKVFEIIESKDIILNVDTILYSTDYFY